MQSRPSLTRTSTSPQESAGSHEIVIQGNRGSFRTSTEGIQNGLRHSHNSATHASVTELLSQPRTSALDEEKDHRIALLGQPEEQDALLAPIVNATNIRQVRRHLNNLRRDLPWFSEIMDYAPVPDRFDFRSWREWARTVITIYCTVAASVLYIEGGSKVGLMYVIGSIISNGVQTAYYTNVTLHFLSHLKEHKKIAGVSGVLALFATIVSSIATFQLSDDSVLIGAIKALLNASGNMPQNSYGMFANLKSMKNYFENNPKARYELLVKLRNALDQSSLQVVIKRDRSMTNHLFNQIVGVGFGIAMSAGQAGYIRSSVSFMTDLTGNSVAGLSLGFLTNLPTLAISMFISGHVLADGIVNQLFDMGNDVLDYAAGRPTQTHSPRESAFIIARLFSVAGLIYFALYSGATSKFLYNNMPPLPYLPTAEPVDEFLEVAVDQGAQLFNAVMSILSWFALLNYFEKAYVDRESDDYAKYNVQQMQQNIAQLPTERVEAIATRAGVEVIPQRPFYAKFFNSAQSSAVPETKPEQEDEDDLAYHRLEGDEVVVEEQKEQKEEKEQDARNEAEEPSTIHHGFQPGR